MSIHMYYHGLQVACPNNRKIDMFKALITEFNLHVAQCYSGATCTGSMCSEPSHRQALLEEEV